MAETTGSGRWAEDRAEEYLRARGYKIVQRNFRAAGGEIDIVAVDGKTLCFVEVKFRRGLQQGHPSEAVTPVKQRKITKTALFYLQQNPQSPPAVRFDVLAIRDSADGLVFELIANAFDAVT